MAGIELSEKAAVRIRALSQEKATPNGGLRLGVKGGGCSGLSYFIDWAEAPSKHDQVIERDGARLFVDPKSAVFLAGTVVDWQQTLDAERLRVPQPQREERLRLRRVVHHLEEFRASAFPLRAGISPVEREPLLRACAARSAGAASWSWRAGRSSARAVARSSRSPAPRTTSRCSASSASSPSTPPSSSGASASSRGCCTPIASRAPSRASGASRSSARRASTTPSGT